MEIRIVLFLACVSVVMVSNTLVLIVAYRLFSQFTGKLTKAVTDFSNSGQAREWIDWLHVGPTPVEVSVIDL